MFSWRERHISMTEIHASGRSVVFTILMTCRQVNSLRSFAMVSHGVAANHKVAITAGSDVRCTDWRVPTSVNNANNNGGEVSEPCAQVNSFTTKTDGFKNPCWGLARMSSRQNVMRGVWTRPYRSIEMVGVNAIKKRLSESPFCHSHLMLNANGNDRHVSFLSGPVHTSDAGIIRRMQRHQVLHPVTLVSYEPGATCKSIRIDKRLFRWT